MVDFLLWLQQSILIRTSIDLASLKTGAHIAVPIMLIFPTLCVALQGVMLGFCGCVTSLILLVWYELNDAGE